MGTRIFLTLAIFASAILGGQAVAQGQGNCDIRDNILVFLQENYGEVPVQMGVSSGGGLVEVLASPQGETWSIIVTAPGGPSCLVAEGNGWRGSVAQAIPEGQGS